MAEWIDRIGEILRLVREFALAPRPDLDSAQTEYRSRLADRAGGLIVRLATVALLVKPGQGATLLGMANTLSSLRGGGLHPEEETDVLERVVQFVDLVLSQPPPHRLGLAVSSSGAATAPAVEGQEPSAALAVRVVSTGFSPREAPANFLDPATPLEPAAAYWFGLQVGPPVPNSIEETPAALPQLPEGAILTVALYPFGGELILDSKADVGELRLGRDGTVTVARQPGSEPPAQASRQLLETRLLFPVRTPERRGPARLRCNLYHERLLIQSRLITAAVGAPSEDVRALRSRLDFVLSHTLSPAHLARLEPQRLSVFINSSGNGTHEFSFLGESSFKQHASLDVALVQDAIGGARRALRRVSWGTDGEWRTSDPDCYAAPRSSPDFQRDLITLAAAGYQLYDKLADSLAGGAEKSRELADLMRKPGTVQISTKETARLVVPAALIYDKPLDTQATTLSVCNEFLKALDSRTPLLDSPCLNGDCPNWKDVEIVCPGGFWGYRHSIALPVSLSDPLAGDVPAEIVYTDAPALTVVVSLDEKLSERPAHEQRLKDLRVPLGWNWIGDRNQALKQLGTVAAQVVYFYCHGGLSKNVPYLLVGSGANDYITPDNIRAYGIRWAKPRPLVFLNGCKTTAVEPEIALEFVTSFISRANAAGVIGTEITVFEPLATTFAETFLRLFLVDSLTLGESVRRARLALLASSNPLGLVYIPFALGGLRLAAEG